MKSDRHAARPFRILNAKTQEHLRGRAYSNPKRAARGASTECEWSPLGTTFEVYDIRQGNLLAQYTRRVKGIDIYHSRTFRSWLRLYKNA